MGLLDDAIREHLDLKRRHGADPAELERAEHEALGPVRREPEARPAEAPSFDEGIEGRELEPSPEPWEDHPPPPLDEDDPEPEPPRRSRLSRIFGRVEDEDELDYGEEELEPDDPQVRDQSFKGEAPGSIVDADPPTSGVGQETAAFDVAGAHDEQPDEDEDVLEETPEFLQDTPDHDRLWFEQRPPRDFDFDG